MDINENVFIDGDLILTGSLTQRAKQMTIVSGGPTSLIISASTTALTPVASAYIKLMTKANEALNFGSTVGTTSDTPCLIGIAPANSRSPENNIYPGVIKDTLLVSNDNRSGSIQFGTNNSIAMTIQNNKIGIGTGSLETDLHMTKDGSVLRLGNSSGSINFDDGALFSQYSGSIQFCEASTTGSMDHGVSINFTSSQTPSGPNPEIPRLSYFDIRGHENSVDGTISVKIPKDGKKIGIGNFPIDNMPEAKLHLYDGANPSGVIFKNTTFAIENTGSQADHYAMRVSTAAPNAFCVTNSGKVGIGNSTPSYPLEIAGISGNTWHMYVKNNILVGGDIRHAGDENNKIVFSTDAQGFYTNGSLRMHIDSSGHIVKPSQPAFMAKLSSAQEDIPITTNTKVQFASERFDQGADYNTSTYVFTAPETGRYLLSTELYFSSVDKDHSGYIKLEIVTSNHNYLVDIVDPDGLAADIAFLHLGGTIVADMDVNDTAYVNVYVSAGDATNDIATRSYFSGCLLC